MKAFLFGLVLGILALPLFALYYFRSGNAPVATAAPPLPMENMLASMALNARISKEAPKDAPIPASEENLMDGAKTYRQYCAVCHGVGVEPQTPTAKGMYPRPPELFKGKGVTDDPVGETYWKVKNGIRLTGMPAYGISLPDTQIWQVGLLLANAGKLPANVSAWLANPTPAK